MTAAEYALSLADVTADEVAVDVDGTSWSLIDSAGDFAGLATWEQLQASVAAGDEGWIEGVGLDVYVEGNVDAMAAALAAFWAVAS
jgi:hypothetical protein